MTSPAVGIEVTCPRCGHSYTGFYRPSINLTPYRPPINLTLGEEWTQERIDQATTATCPQCDLQVDLETLIVG